MVRSRRWLAPGAVAAVVLIVGGPASAATGWTVVSVPATGNNTELNGAYAISSTDAWAVGVQFGAAGVAPPPPVAYHWNGKAWTLTATPSLGVNATLTGVSASGASDVWAVGANLANGGYRRGLALYEHWNGTAWSVVPGPGGSLNAVAAVSTTNAWAVGIGGIVEHWDGTAWSAVTVPSPNPSDTFGNNLTAITARSATDVWAVGEFTNTSFTNSAYALHYDGVSWTVSVLPQPLVTGPSSPVLHGVTAVAANDVWAVGENEEVPGLGITTLIEHWNGSGWSIVPSPTPGAYPALNAVAARSATDVAAVGFNDPSINGGVQQGLILHWNGTAWSADADPTAGTFSPLYGAAAVRGGTAEWAVGINSGNQGLVLAQS